CPDAQVIKRCNQPDCSSCQRLSSSEYKRVRLRLEWHVKIPDKNRRGHRWCKETNKSQEARSDNCGSPWCHNHGSRPTKEKSPHRANSTAQINVVTTRVRNGGTQFGITKRSEKDNHSAEDPSSQNLPHRTHFSGHIAGNQKNCLPDHGPDHDR